MAIKGGDPILEKQNWGPWFFGLCACLFASYGVAIHQEFVARRTYIHYQTTFNAFEHDYLSKEFEALRTSKAQDLVAADALKAKHDAAEKSLTSPSTRTFRGRTRRSTSRTAT